MRPDQGGGRQIQMRGRREADTDETRSRSAPQSRVHRSSESKAPERVRVGASSPAAQQENYDTCDALVWPTGRYGSQARRAPGVGQAWACAPLETSDGGSEPLYGRSEPYLPRSPCTVTAGPIDASARASVARREGAGHLACGGSVAQRIEPRARAYSTHGAPAAWEARFESACPTEAIMLSLRFD